MSNIQHSRRAGNSLIQAIVAIAILLNFGGIAVVWAQQAREDAARKATMSGLKQIATAVHSAHDQLKKLPPIEGTYGQKNEGTFHYHLLPFMGQAQLAQLYINPDPNGVFLPFLSSEDPTRTRDGAGATNFVVNLRLFYTKGGLGEFSDPKTPIKLQWPMITAGDGMSNTLLFSTKYQVCGATGGSMWLDPGKNGLGSRTAATFGESMQIWQKAPTQADCNPTAGTAVSFNEKTISVVLCDASVHTVSADISRATWQALHTYAGMDEVGKDFRGK